MEKNPEITQEVAKTLKKLKNVQMTLHWPYENEYKCSNNVIWDQDINTIGTCTTSVIRWTHTTHGRQKITSWNEVAKGS